MTPAAPDKITLSEPIIVSAPELWNIVLLLGSDNVNLEAVMLKPDLSKNKNRYNQNNMVYCFNCFCAMFVSDTK